MSVFKSFATSFLEGMTKNVTERRTEAKEERKRKERIAETAGLQQYLKRQANFNKYMNIAKKIKKLADPDGTNAETQTNIAKLVTNPELLLSANTYIENFARKYPEVKITPARINGLIGNLDLVMPEKGMSLEEAAKNAAGLAFKNTNLEEEKKDPNAMESNMIMSLFGVDAETRELEKLKSTMVGQKYSNYDLYKMAMGGEYSPIDQATGMLDTSFFPTPFTVQEESLLQKVVENSTKAGIDAQVQILEERKQKNDPNFRDVIDDPELKDISDALAKLSLIREGYATNGTNATTLEAKYASSKIASDILTSGKLNPYMQSQIVGKQTKINALNVLVNDPIAVNRFGIEEMKRQASLLGHTLLRKGEVDNPTEGDGAGNLNSDAKINKEQVNKEVSKDLSDDLASLKTKAFDLIDKENGIFLIDKFVEVYKQENLPLRIEDVGGEPRPEGENVNQFTQRQWDRTFGKYYNADGTRK